MELQDCLTLLRSSVMRKTAFPELRDGMIIFHDYKLQFPRNTQTSYQTKAGPFLTLDAVWFCILHESLTPSEYLKKCTEEGFPQVPMIHRRDLLTHMKGEKESAQIQMIPLVVGQPLAVPAPVERAPAAAEEAKPRPEDLQRSKEEYMKRLDSTAAGASSAVVTAEKLPQVEGGAAISSDKIAELKAKRAARKRAQVRDVEAEEATKTAEKKKGGDLFVEADASITASIKARERVLLTRSSILCSQKKSFAPLLRVLAKLAKEYPMPKGVALPSSMPLPGPATAAAPPASSSSGPAAAASGPHPRPDMKHPGAQIGHKRAHEAERPRASSGPTKPPIIVVPPALTALCTVFNARDFLERGEYIPPSEKKERDYQGKHPGTITVSCVREGGKPTLPFVVADDVTKFSRGDWDRVVAVFVLGPQWQFKDWPWKDPVELFAHVRGFSLQWQLSPVNQNIQNWNVKVLKLSRDHCNLGQPLMVEFWRDLLEWMQRNKPHLLPPA